MPFVFCLFEYGILNNNYWVSVFCIGEGKSDPYFRAGECIRDKVMESLPYRAASELELVPNGLHHTVLPIC